MRPVIRVVPLLMVVLLQVAAAQTIPHLTPFSADFTATNNRGGEQEKSGKLYVGREHMRWENTSGGPGGAGGIMIMNFATHTSDVLMPEQHMYMEFNADQMQGMRPGMAPKIKPLPDPDNPCANQEGMTCKNLGVEDVNGRSADHWQITNKQGKTGDVWIDRKLHFPIKSVDQDSTWLLSNIKEGEPAADMFDIPIGYQKMDMGQMMQGMRPPQQ